jgi:prolipoprotein diacylglyceryltransferase
MMTNSFQIELVPVHFYGIITMPGVVAAIYLAG